jgi:hypothetical protein
MFSVEEVVVEVVMVNFSLVWVVSAVMFDCVVGVVVVGSAGLLNSDQRREALKDEMVGDMYVIEIWVGSRM